MSGKDTKEHGIVKTNRDLIAKLTEAFMNARNKGDIQLFRTAYLNAMNQDLRKIYNTHRDSAVNQIFGAIAELFSNLWENMFSSKEDYAARNKTRSEASRFFKSDDRITRSAKKLYECNAQMEQLCLKNFGVNLTAPDERSVRTPQQ